MTGAYPAATSFCGQENRIANVALVGEDHLAALERYWLAIDAIEQRCMNDRVRTMAAATTQLLEEPPTRRRQ